MAAQETQTRPYRMRRRQEEMEETRRRIVEAAVELHGSIGPAQTTISGIADLAGVQRSTVYRHFADEEAIFSACTSHWLGRHPWPRTDRWRDIEDPVERLSVGLRELYRYYSDNRQMLANNYRDIEVVPPFVGDIMRGFVDGAHEALTAGWPGRRRRAEVRHAIDFRTWQSLDEQGLDPDEGADLMAVMVTGVG
ncbi:MAG: TetR/AcrR family transcriptional regulator [Acidimicrobiia bacterium]